MEKKDFDIYNTEEIYSYVLGIYQEIYQETGLDMEFKLSTFLKNFKIANEMNFKSFSLSLMNEDFQCLIEEKHQVKPKDKDTEELHNNNEDNPSNNKRSTQATIKRSITEINPRSQQPTTSIPLIKKKPLSKKNPQDLKMFSQLQKAKEIYLKQFLNIFSTSFIDIICSNSYDMVIDYREIFFKFCVEAIYNLRKYTNENIISLLTILNKLLSYDVEDTQNSISGILNQKSSVRDKSKAEEIIYQEVFFETLVQILEQKLNINMVTCKNFLIPERYENINMSTKIILQFIKLLGEGHNKAFQSLIIRGKADLNNKPAESEGKKLSININDDDINQLEPCALNGSIPIIPLAPIKSQTGFSVVCKALKYVIELLDKRLTNTNTHIVGEMPFDKLIIVMKNIIDCLIKFFQGTSPQFYSEMYDNVKNVFPNMTAFLFDKRLLSEENSNEPNTDNESSSSRHKLILSVKICLMDLIASLIEDRMAYSGNVCVLTEVMVAFNPIDLYEEAVMCFYDLYTLFRPKFGGDVTLDKESVVPALIELYTFDEKFQKSLELNFSLKIFYYIKILSDVYERLEVVNYLANLKTEYQKAKENDTKKKQSESEDNLTAKRVESYNLPRIPTNTPSDGTQDNNTLGTNFAILKPNPHDSSNANANSPESPYIFHARTLKSIRTNAFNETSDKKQKEQLKANYQLFHFNVYQFLSKLMSKIQIRCEMNQSSKEISFFVIPPICLLLSEQTIASFISNVDRDSVHSKVSTLVSETDYFIYEMFYNNRMMRNFSRVKKFLYNINLKNWELLNYCLIIVENVLLIYHYFSMTAIDPKVKYTIYTDLMVVNIVMLFMLSGVLFIWFKFKFSLYFTHNLMKIYNQRFIFRNFENGKSRTEAEGVETLMNRLGEGISCGSKLKVAIVDSVIMNREVNIFVFTFVLIILYFATGSALWLVIPILFAANLNNILFGIVIAIQLRWGQLLTVLIYTYLIVYVFSWIAFYFYTDSFALEDLLNLTAGNKVTENMCSSALQCYLTHLDYGVRSGGGIGDILTKISFQTSSGYFMARFFYNILFHILVVWMMANLFFGIIVDAFADLRDKNTNIENDKKNVCFICQMTRDSAMNKNIDFDQHTKTVHFLWNYVYFLTYLNINNQSNFKSLENYVWNKIHSMDISWIPIGEVEEKHIPSI